MIWVNSSGDQVGNGVQKDQHIVCGRKRKKSFLAEFCPTQKSMPLPFCSSAALWGNQRQPVHSVVTYCVL